MLISFMLLSVVVALKCRIMSAFIKHGAQLPTGALPLKRYRGRSTVANVCPTPSELKRDLVDLHNRTYDVKCPFIRRKSFDALELADAALRTFTFRNGAESLFTAHNSADLQAKLCSPTVDDIAERIQIDWCNRGYYVTGNLTTAIYKDNCVFDGPDPDMPVYGLRKFVLTAAQLFVHSESNSELLGPLIIDRFNKTITAYWRISGRMNLPWKPKVKPWTGNTMYIIDPHTGLIEKHIEQWDISVFEAFFCTLFPFACRS